MLTLLLIIIYISFISLGLPDSVLGSAWPSMQVDLEVPISYAGIVSVLVTVGTIVSSFFSNKIIEKLGTGMVTLISVATTAIALLGFSIAPSFIWICVCAIPLGLGAGSVDAALNNFVALHYKAKHMSWLHCFWGIGATMGPVIMSFYLVDKNNWSGGFQTIGMIQLCLVAILVLAMPLWKCVLKTEKIQGENYTSSLTTKEIFNVKGAKAALIGFFCYCALEATAGLWASSFLVVGKGINAETAAKWVSLFYLGITIGRLIAGFATINFANTKMIRFGQAGIAIGIIVLILPINYLVLPIGLFLIGAGCAPIYPCMLHSTPINFGSKLSQAMMGIQMACAYLGAAFMPPFFGFLADNVTINFYPLYLFIILIVMVIGIEKLNRVVKTNKHEKLFIK